MPGADLDGNITNLILDMLSLIRYLENITWRYQVGNCADEFRAMAWTVDLDQGIAITWFLFKAIRQFMINRGVSAEREEKRREDTQGWGTGAHQCLEVREMRKNQKRRLKSMAAKRLSWKHSEESTTGRTA